MSFLKKVWATLAGGREQAPDYTAAGEKYRQETIRESALAKEREEMQKARMETQKMNPVSDPLTNEEIEINVPENLDDTDEMDQQKAA